MGIGDTFTHDVFGECEILGFSDKKTFVIVLDKSENVTRTLDWRYGSFYSACQNYLSR